jgi:predicted nucleic acid-binding protein
METAHPGVILDSSVAIEAERGNLNTAQFLKQIIGKIGEMEVALYRADTRGRRERRRVFLDELKAAVPVFSITEQTAELVGKIGAESAAAGDDYPF